MNKILRSLPSTWDAKSTAIQEAKDLATLPLEQLIGSLMTYEMNLQQKLAEFEKKKKVIALKTTTSIDESSGSTSEEGEDDEMPLISRKCKRFMRKKKPRYRREHYKAKSIKEKEKEKENKGRRTQRPNESTARCNAILQGHRIENSAGTMHAGPGECRTMRRRRRRRRTECQSEGERESLARRGAVLSGRRGA